MAQLNVTNEEAKVEGNEGFTLPSMKIYTFADNGDSNLVGRAYVHTALFKYNGIRIIKGANGNFISMPSRKSNRTGEDGKPVYFDRFYLVSKEARDALSAAILAELESPSEKTKDAMDMTYGEADIQVEVNVNKDDAGNPEVKNGVLATAKVTTPLMVHPWIEVRQSKQNEDEFFLSFPSYKTDKQDEQGKDIYNRYFEPFNREAREFLEKIILAKVEEQL